jgi:hypothetical protein
MKKKLREKTQKIVPERLYNVRAGAHLKNFIKKLTI